MNLAIVGTGKVGTTLGIAFERAGHRVTSVSSRDLKLAQKAVDAADIVFLSVSDAAVASVAAQLQWRAAVGVVHCSGSLDVATLAVAAAHGARTASFHPVQMFAEVQSALASLPETTVVLDGDASLLDELESLSRQIHATPLRLQLSNRALYHAAVNYAGPFVVALLREASTLWSRLGVSEEQTLRALIPLIRSTLNAVEAVGLAAGMGGAVARGDTRTIAGHVSAFREGAPDQLELYCALQQRVIPLALERGSLTPEGGRDIRQLLQSPDRSVLEALLDSWDRNNTILINLLRSVPDGGLDVKAMAGSPDLASLFTHVHYVRLVFVCEDAPEWARPVPEDEWTAERDVDRLAGMLDESAKAVCNAVNGRLEAGRNMDRHYDHPILMLQHLIWHEGYHHGQIKLALKLAGHPMDDLEVGPGTWGIWMKKSRS